jgi:hypothetical protein
LNGLIAGLVAFALRLIVGSRERKIGDKDEDYCCKNFGVHRRLLGNLVFVSTG